MKEGTDDSAGSHDERVVIDLRETPAADGSGRIPFVDLGAQHAPIKEEILAEWARLLASGAFIGGEPVDRFEEHLADFVGAECAVGVANGTEAITLALLGLGLERGDEVITAANTFYATVEAITHAGGSPVLVDVDPATATIDPESIEKAITHRTRFIIPVHLYGQPADMDAIMDIADRHGLKVVEDNAQAIGATYKGRRTGSIGHASAVSFYPGKNLGATGDGGAVTTNLHEVARRVRVLANHGSRTKYQHIAVGYNSRLDAIHAAALTIKLRHLDEWNQGRRDVAKAYEHALSGTSLELPSTAHDRSHVFHLYVVRARDRSGLQAALGDAGIATGLHYPTPIHLTEPYAHLGNGPGTFPVSEYWASHGLSLPMFPELDPQSIARIAGEISRFEAREHVLTLDSA